MISLFKKTVLTVAMVGCVFGAQAKEKDTSTIAKVKSTLAMAGIGVGTAAMLCGGRYFEFPADHRGTLPFDMHKWEPRDVFAAVLVPGVFLAGAGVYYLFSSAKQGWKNKLCSVAGTASTALGSLVFTVATVSLMNEKKNNFGEGFQTLLFAALGVGATTLGYCLQQKSTPEKAAQLEEQPENEE
jgi:hypothetical protein